MKTVEDFLAEAVKSCQKAEDLMYGNKTSLAVEELNDAIISLRHAVAIIADHLQVKKIVAREPEEGEHGRDTP